MQQIISLQLVAVGAGVAWFTRQRTVKPGQSKKPGDADDTANAGSSEAELERSATQWLARNGPGGLGSSLSSEPATAHTTSYADLELLAEGELVYLRSDGSVLTALAPAARRLELQPLQLVKGKPDGVPTGPLESTSVWVVRRWKQQIAFELQGSHQGRHVLEADPDTPHGVALGGGLGGRRSRWLISPKGLVSARWPAHVLPLQLVPVQLVDGRAVPSVKASLGKKVADLAAKLEDEIQQRTAVEAERDKLEAELRACKEEAAAQAAELHSQLDAALRARHAANRDVSSLQAQKADETMRAKMAQARASQLEYDLQLSEGTVRRQQQQIQGMLAGHAEELRTLQQELQIARETNDGLKRAMGEQVLSLQGALELRDARILELEEENDRMDTVLQVIQTQLGGACGSLSLPTRNTLDSNRPTLDSQPDGPAAAETGAEGTGTGEAELSLSEMVRHGSASAGSEQQPLWRSLLDLTGDLSLTALKESLAISRRSTADAAPQAETPVAAATPQASQAQQPPLEPLSTFSGAATAPGAARELNRATDGTPETQAGPHPWTVTHSPDGGSSVGSTNGAGLPAAGEWGSGGGESLAPLLGGEESEFVSAAARMSGVLRSSGGASPAPEAAAGAAPPQQVSGAAGSGVGCGSSAAEEVVGAAGERPGVFNGGILDLRPIQTTLSIAARTPRSVGGAAATPQAAPGAFSPGPSSGAGGPTSAQLEYGLEATLTLDSLRRRMRELDAEKERLQLLRTSLEETLPWRPAKPAEGGGGGSSRFVPTWAQPGVSLGAVNVAEVEVVDNARSGGDGDAALGEEEDVAAGSSRVGRCEEGAAVGQTVVGPMAARSGIQELPTGGSGVGADPDACRRGTQAAGDSGGLGTSKAAKVDHQKQSPRLQPGARPLTQAERRRLKRGTLSRQSQQSSAGASPSSPAVPERPSSSAGAQPNAECGLPSGRVRRIAQELFGGSGGGAGCSTAPSSPAGKANYRLMRSSGGASSLAGSTGEGAKPTGAVAPPTAHGSPPDTARERSDDRTQSGSSSLPPGNAEEQAGEAGSAASSSAAASSQASGGPLRLPELRIDDGRALADEEGYGVYDSIDAMCNLGSTRAMPSFRGGGGAMTARRVGPTTPEAFRSPVRPVGASGVPAAGTPSAAPVAAASSAACGGGAVVTTPKSFTSTPGGGTDVGADDDAAVHCDDQELSPSQGVMLLGSLEQLRSAAASSLGAVAAGGPAGGRLSAFHEDEEEDE